MQSFFTCLITGLMFNSFWYSYILSLVFLGGLLILFIYVTSLASNEMSTFSMKISLFVVSSISLIFFIMLFIDNNLVSSIFPMDNLYKFNTPLNLTPANSLSLINLYNFPTSIITILLMNYYMYILIAVVKITNIFHGPLRPMFSN